jgi:hypothetical protein
MRLRAAARRVSLRYVVALRTLFLLLLEARR